MSELKVGDLVEIVGPFTERHQHWIGLRAVVGKVTPGGSVEIPMPGIGYNDGPNGTEGLRLQARTVRLIPITEEEVEEAMNSIITTMKRRTPQ